MSNREYFSADVEKALATFGEKIRNLEEENQRLRNENRKLVDPNRTETLIYLLLKWREHYGNEFSVAFPVSPSLAWNPDLEPFPVRLPHIYVSLRLCDVSEELIKRWRERECRG